MANTFVADLVPRILPTTLEVLREQAPLLGWANKDYAASAGMLGDTVTIQKSVPLAVGDVTPAMFPPSPSNLAPGFTTITIDKWKKANFALTSKEYAEIIAGNQVPFQVEEAVRSVVNQIAETVWDDYYKISNLVGTAATGMFASNSIAAAAAAAYALDKSLCPRGNRRMFVSLRDAADARTNTAYGQYYNIGKEPVGENIVRDGQLKALYDFKSVEQDYFTPVNTVAATLGGGTGALAANAAAGATSISVTITGGAGAVFEAGTVITVGTETGNGRNTYSVVTAANIAAAGTGTLVLNRGLSSAKVLSTATVTLPTQATAINNIAGDMSGIGLVMRFPAQDLMGNRIIGDSYPLIDPQTGAVLCLSHIPGYHQSMWEVSALYGSAMVDERKLVRIQSYAALSA